MKHNQVSFFLRTSVAFRRKKKGGGGGGGDTLKNGGMTDLLFKCSENTHNPELISSIACYFSFRWPFGGECFYPRHVCPLNIVEKG